MPNQGSIGDDSHFVFHQKLLCEDGSVRWGAVMVKQPGLFLPKFSAMSSHVFMQLLQNVLVESRIHSLACWDRCFALTQLPYRWWHQSRIFWIPPHISDLCTNISLYPHVYQETESPSAVMPQNLDTHLRYVTYINPFLLKLGIPIGVTAQQIN
jgi:hypothetical protein